eukprot:1157234-Pelagomonas_calceolata.AAC.15
MTVERSLHRSAMVRGACLGFGLLTHAPLSVQARPPSRFIAYQSKNSHTCMRAQGMKIFTSTETHAPSPFSSLVTTQSHPEQSPAASPTAYSALPLNTPITHPPCTTLALSLISTSAVQTAIARTPNPDSMLHHYLPHTPTPCFPGACPPSCCGCCRAQHQRSHDAGAVQTWTGARRGAARHAGVQSLLNGAAAWPAPPAESKRQSIKQR